MKLPHYDSIEKWILRQLSGSGKRPWIVGINAPQGAGKTTLCNALLESFKAQGLGVMSISIDDFYLTRAEQIALSQAHPENPYWQARGYPGTHDIELGVRTLEGLKRGERVQIPRYDKSAFSGKGDRLPLEKLTWSESSLDIVLFEGWMLGFPPVVSTSLMSINSALENYRKWNQFLDCFIHIEARDTQYIVNWRVQAEQAMRDQGKTAMSEEEVLKYARSFLPAYETYVPALRANPPLPRERCLSLVLDQKRLPVEVLD